ncbi:hypothetical protein [Nonomuraea sp. NPDC002799]
MTEPTGGSENRPRRPVAVPVVALVAITAVGITALLGGLNEATVPPDPLSQGAVIDQGLYSTKFVESRVTVDRGSSQFEEDKRFVELIFEVTNKGDETLSVGLPAEKPEQAYVSTSFASSLVRITPAFGKDAGPFAFARVKGGESRQLHPGVTSQVVLRYLLKDDQQPPDKVSFDVATFEERPDFGSKIPRWQMIAEEAGERSFLPEVKARVTLQVKKGEAS